METSDDTLENGIFSNIKIEHYLNVEATSSNNSLRYVLINARSLRKNFENIINFLKTLNTQPHIIVITEIWIYYNEVQFYTLPGYRGGGIAIYVVDSIVAIEKEQVNCLGTSFIVIDLPLCHSKVISIYRTEKCPDEIFFCTLENLLLKYPKSLVLGDININLFNSGEKKMIWLKSVVSCSGYMILNKMSVDFYTRFSSTPSAIDHIITDLIQFNFKVSLFDCSEFDHRIILIDKADNVGTVKCKPTKEFRVIDYDKIFLLLPHVRFNDINTFKQLSEALSELVTHNSKSMKKHNTKPWVTSAFLSIVKTKNIFYYLQNKYPSNSYFKERFKYYRNLAVYSKRNILSSYNQSALQQALGNSKATWIILNKMIFNKESNNSGNTIISMSNKMSEVKHDPYDISNIFNEYFVNVANSSVGLINYTIPHFSTYLKYERLPPLNFANTNYLEILNIIKNLNKTAASGYDSISAKFIEKCKYFLIPTIVKLINISINKGYVPDSLKLSIVHPIYKTGSKMVPSNYRPISILNVFSKIFEKIIVGRLHEYFVCNKILHPNQFGFIEKSSTQSAATAVLNEIILGLESKEYVAMLSIDLKKAFDTVPHNILLSKIKMLNPSKSTFSLLSSYFINRIQYTVVNGIKSKPLTIVSGVPQGSVLSPIMFNYFINDIFNLDLSGKLFMYADDSVLIYKSKSSLDLLDQMLNDIRKVEDWLCANKMYMNMTKTNYLIFQNKQFPEHFPCYLEINNIRILQVATTTYLGLVIDEHLNWKEQILKVKKSVWPYAFAIKRIRNHIDEKTAWLIYNAYINSRLSYMSMLWTAASKNSMKTLRVLQNRIVKTIKCLPVLTPTKSLYSPQTLPIEVLGNFQLLVFIKKALTALTKSNFIFVTISEMHSYNTRSNSNHFLYLPTVSTTRSQNNPFYKGQILFNELKPSIRNELSLQKYQSLLKVDLITKWMSEK